MKALACWEKSDAERILRTEALQGDPAIFSAIHTGLHGINVDGPLRASLLESSELGLLSLLSAERPHTFCIVEGLPGAGKSHLIRWLAAYWAGENDEMFLIPRADGSLTGTLRRLREQLGRDYESIFAGVADPSRVALTGRANDFQSRLANSMREDYYEGTPPVHAEFCSRNKIYDLIGNQRVLEKWSAPRRILELLSGAEGRRDQESANFMLRDIAELARAAVGVQLSPHAIMFRNPLSKEETKLRPLLDDERSDAEIRNALGDDAIPNSLKLVEALNARRNDAIRDLLGLGRNAVKDLFRKLRLELQVRKKRLVLMLEDVTSFEGVDDQLIEAIIQRSDVQGNEDLCPLVAICGVTPDYFARIHTLGNVQDRIDIHVRLEGDGNVLATEEDRSRFAARYLRAIRAGVASLTVSKPPTNRCLLCPQRVDCHREFGSVRLDEDEVGLYPFNSRSLDSLFESLEDVRGRGKRIQTPRSFLKAVLGPSLLEPQHIVDGTFPTAQIETSWHPEHARHRVGAAGGTMGNALEQRQKGGGAEVLQRLRRLIAWWGDWAQVRTTHDERGDQLAFGAVPRGVFETFELPWIGDESGSTAVPPKEPALIPPTDGPAVGEPEQEEEPQPKGGTKEKGRQPLPKGGQKKKRKPEKERDGAARSAELAAWKSNGALEHAEFWNQQLLRLVEGLPWGQLAVDQWARQELFTDALVALEGTKGGQRTNYFVVPSEDVIIRGLEALVQLSSESDEAPEPNWYSVATSLRRLGELAQAHVKRVLADGEAGRWQFMPLLGQALLARAYVRGRTSPNVALVEQWATLWNGTDELADASRGRVDSWQTWLDQTKHVSGLPEVFERGLGVPRPDGRKPRWLDVSIVVPALQRFSRDLQFDRGPAQPPQADKFAQLRRFVQWTENRSLTSDLARRERERLRRLLGEIDTMSAQRSMQEHLGKVRKALDAAVGQAPEFVAVLARDWQQLRSEVFGSAATGETASPDPMWDRVDDVVQNTIEASELARVEALVGADVLAWCLSIRADEVTRAAALLRRLDELVTKVHLGLQDLVDTRIGETGQLEAELAATADVLDKALDRIDVARGAA